MAFVGLLASLTPSPSTTQTKLPFFWIDTLHSRQVLATTPEDGPEVLARVKNYDNWTNLAQERLDKVNVLIDITNTQAKHVVNLQAQITQKDKESKDILLPIVLGGVGALIIGFLGGFFAR